MTRIPLEICVDTIEGARTAAENGADRIELCAALSEGGLTPSCGFMAAASDLPVPVYAMIRPRGGDFRYSDHEKAMMLRDIDAAAHAGLAGIVIGAVDRNRALDAAFLSEALSCTSLPSTLHRAFDTLNDPIRGVSDAVDLGFERILTSGLAMKAEFGLETLKSVVAIAGDRISIMAGAGVTVQNAARILGETGVHELHASCSSMHPGASRETQEGRLGFVSPEGSRATDASLVRALRQAMDQFKETAA